MLFRIDCLGRIDVGVHEAPDTVDEVAGAGAVIEVHAIILP
jgi:hypothetical protein